MEFKKRNHYGITVYESDEMIKGSCDLMFPKYRIVHRKEEGQLLFVPLEYKNGEYNYGVISSCASKKLCDTIDWINSKIF